MLNLTNAQVLADNRIDINGVNIGTFTDDEAQRIIDIARGILNERNSKASTPMAKPMAIAPSKGLNVVEEPSTSNDKPVGKPVWQEDFLTVTLAEVDGKKQYRLYVTCPVGGEKGKAIRYAIKASAKEHGAKFAGNYNAKEIFWAFPSKAKADEFVKARKAYDKENGKH